MNIHGNIDILYSIFSKSGRKNKRWSKYSHGFSELVMASRMASSEGKSKSKGSIVDMKTQMGELIVTSCSTEHTYIDLFFEDTCVKVIWLWYIMISFRLWIIYHDDDDVIW